jgi:hypothetical protein
MPTDDSAFAGTSKSSSFYSPDVRLADARLRIGEDCI